MIIDKCNLRDAANNRFPILSLSLEGFHIRVIPTLIRGTNGERSRQRVESSCRDGLFSPLKSLRAEENIEEFSLSIEY